MATEQQMAAIQEAGRRGILNPQQVQSAFELQKRGKLEGDNLIKVKDRLAQNIGQKKLKEQQNEELGISGRAVVGLGRGFKDIGEGLKQAGLEATDFLGITGNAADEYTKKAEQERAIYEQGLGDSAAADIGRFAGNVLPTLVVPGGITGSLATRAGTAGLSGAAIGGLGFVPEDGSRAEQAALGGLFGSLGSLATSGVKAGYNALKPSASNATDTVKQLLGKRTGGLVDEFTGGDITGAASKRLRSAERLGEIITPAEALDDPILAARQGASGTSEEGARKLVDFGRARTEEQGQKIGKFLNDLSPNEATAAPEIRATAQKILREQQDALSKQAAPLYEKAFQTKVAAKTIKALSNDPVLADAAAKVQKSPLYKKALAGAGPKDLKFWDLVKREVDDQIEKAVRSGGRNESRLLQDSKRALTSALDDASPDYSAARAIYGEGARPLQQLREGVVGRLAELEDSQLKNVSKILFDTNQTDPAVLGRVRQQFIKENPDAWRRVIRNEMERRLDMMKSDRTGTSFFNAMLSKDRDFRMFLNATRGMPDIQRTLIDMRRVWGNLINPETVKGAATKAKSSLDVPRSSAEAIANFIKNKLGGKADKAAVELITDPKWSQEITRIAAIKSQKKRDSELLRLMVEIAGKGTRGTLATQVAPLVNAEASEISK